MTHRIHLPLLACILIAVFATPVFAQTTVDAEASVEIETGTPGSPPVKPLDVIRARAQEIKQGAERLPGALPAPMPNQRPETVRNRVASTTQFLEGMKTRIMQHGGVIKNRFRLAIEHLTNILERTETRLEKMAAAGVDTSAAVALHADATKAVEKAEADAKAVADYVASVTDSSERTAVRAELEAKLKTAHASLKAAHEAVRKAVKALVDLAKANKPQGDANASVETSVTSETDVQ